MKFRISPKDSLGLILGIILTSVILFSTYFSEVSIPNTYCIITTTVQLTLIHNTHTSILTNVTTITTNAVFNVYKGTSCP